MELARIMIVAAVIWHILVLIFAQMTTLWAGIVMLMLCGFAQSLTMVCHTVILLSASTPRYRGRIMGVRMLAIYSLPIGLLVAGGLIGWIGFRATASLYAVVGLAFTILIAVRWRASLWQARTLPEELHRHAAVGSRARKRNGQPRWASWPDERLLKLRLKDLKLPLRGTWLADCLRELQHEMAEKGLKVRPHAWLSSEWFSPSDTPGIAFPFYLAHPRLMRLERKMIIDVEGGTRAECMRILRHEAGHVMQHSYALHRQPPLAATVRPFIDALSELLSAQSGEPEFRPASAALVRAKPSGRGFRRDLRGLADAALELAQALRRLAGAEEAGICRRADGGDRQAEAQADAADRGRAAAHAAHDARPSITRRSSSTIRSMRRASTTATCCASSPTIRGTATRRRQRPSSGTIAATSGGWSRNGPASISSRSTRCSTR